jgi:hypothetical protein
MLVVGTKADPPAIFWADRYFDPTLCWNTLGSHPPCKMFCAVQSSGPSAVPVHQLGSLVQRSRLTVEITCQRGEPSDVLPDTRPECESPLNVDVSLTVSDDENFLGS